MSSSRAKGLIYYYYSTRMHSIMELLISQLSTILSRRYYDYPICKYLEVHSAYYPQFLTYFKKVKVKFTLEEAMNAQRRSRGVTLLFVILGAR